MLFAIYLYCRSTCALFTQTTNAQPKNNINNNKLFGAKHKTICIQFYDCEPTNNTLPNFFLLYKRQYLLGYIEGCANEYKNNNCKSMQLSIKQ